GRGAPGRFRVRRVPGDLLRESGWHVLDDTSRLSADRADAAGRVGDRWGRCGDDDGTVVLAGPVRWCRTASTVGETTAPRVGSRAVGAVASALGPLPDCPSRSRGGVRVRAARASERTHGAVLDVAAR